MTTRLVATILVSLVSVAGCCGPRPGALLVSSKHLDELRLPSLLDKYGKPLVRERTTAGALLTKEHISIGDVLSAKPADDRLRNLLRLLPADREVEWVVWQRSCWFEITDRFAAAFDPKTGVVIEESGELFMDVWAQTS